MKRWQYIIGVILLIYILGFLASKIISSNKIVQDEIVIIPINGIIATSSSGLPFESSNANVDGILKELKRAKEDSSIKAVILDINSPGGTVVASKELANAVKNLNKPSVAVIREVGASGAYWIASSANEIIADELSITGSVGVISSYLQFDELMQKYGITYERLIAGKYKDLGTPYKNLTLEERNILQSKLDKIHEVFLNDVKKNRKITDVNKISTGEFFLGLEAKDLGLIDKFGNRETAVEDAKKLANLKNPRIVEFQEKSSILDLLGKISYSNFYYLGKGIGSQLSIKDSNIQLNAL